MNPAVDPQSMRSIRSSGLPTRIRLIERIDRGSFGEVWLARDTRVGVDVAVKFLDSGSGGIDGDRFEREARSLARLAGIDGIVGIRELGLASAGVPWLVTDYLPGSSLRTRLELEPAEPYSAAAVALVVELLPILGHALACAHNLGVAHGDISPANILFDAAGRPHLIDFGFAALMRSDTVTPHDAGGLTPAYAAPERLRGARPSPSGDVYSLAATLWHVLAGSTRSEPFEAPSSVQPEGLTSLSDAERSAEFDRIVRVLRAALAASPGQRPTAGELAESSNPSDSQVRRWRYRRGNGKR